MIRKVNCKAVSRDHSSQSLPDSEVHQVVAKNKSDGGIPMASNNRQLLSSTTSTTATGTADPYEIVKQLASSNPVVVFTLSGCAMCTVASRLLFSLGVGPTVIELDRHHAGADIQAVLFQLVADHGRQQLVPAIFIGGKFLGGVETLVACHINGSLKPLLKNAGALWL